jgi:enoyl-CoA hydratase
VERGLEVSLNEGLATEMEEMLQVIATEDAVEGIQAFFTKKEPRFKGR